MSSGAKKHIKDNTICQCTVAQIYRVTPECSARESCENIGFFSLSLPTARAFARHAVHQILLSLLESTCYLDDKRFCRGEGLPL